MPLRMRAKRLDNEILSLTNSLIDGELGFTRNVTLSGPQDGVTVKENYLYIGNESSMTGLGVFPNASDIHTLMNTLQSSISKNIKEIEKMRHMKIDGAIVPSIVNKFESDIQFVKNSINTLESSINSTLNSDLTELISINSEMYKQLASEIGSIKTALADFETVPDFLETLNIRMSVTENSVVDSSGINFDSSVVQESLDYILSVMRPLESTLNSVNMNMESFGPILHYSDANSSRISFLEKEIQKIKEEPNKTESQIMFESFYNSLQTQISINTNHLRYVEGLERIDPELVLDMLYILSGRHDVVSNELDRVNNKLGELDPMLMKLSFDQSLEETKRNSNELIRLKRNLDTDTIKAKELYKDITIWNRGFICEDDDTDLTLKPVSGLRIMMNGGDYFANGITYTVPDRYYTLPEITTVSSLRFIFLHIETGQLVDLNFDYDATSLWGTVAPTKTTNELLDVLLLDRTDINESSGNIARFIDLETELRTNDGTQDDEGLDTPLDMEDLLLIGCVSQQTATTSLATTDIVNYKSLELFDKWGRCEPRFPYLYKKEYKKQITTRWEDFSFMISNNYDDLEITKDKYQIDISLKGISDRYQFDILVIPN